MIERRISFGLGHPLTPMVRNLLIANAAAYLIQLIFSSQGANSFIIRQFALWPQQLWKEWTLWQLVTYQFLHGSFFHLFFNLFTLWMFGCDVEGILGSRRFLGFYLLSGIGAALFHLLFNAHTMVPVIGASGAIYAVLVAFALYFPNRVITLLLFFVLPVEIKARYLVAIFIGISLFSGLSSTLFGASDGVAHLAHLGGALTGYLLLRGGPTLRDLIFEIDKRRQWRRMAAQKRRKTLEMNKRAEIDRLLDRINEVGYDALSKEEKETLHKNSKYIKDE
jgi:membrane associated rhomboid family serine protease